MTTIDVQGLYTVHSSQSLSFTDETAFQFVASGTAEPSTLVNAGQIDASFTTDGIAVVGAGDQGPATFWNKAGATLEVHGGASDIDASTAFSLSAPGSLMRNDGEISVTSEMSVAGGWLIGSRMVNNGAIEAVSGADRGYGVITGGVGSEIVNHGSIHAAGVLGVGFLLLSRTTVVNSGEIRVEGSDLAVALTAGGEGPDVRNSGLIQAIDTDGADAMGIYYGPNMGVYHLNNSGRIVADRAVFAPDPIDIELHIANSGEIVGTVSLAGGDDMLNNSGSIVGDVDLGRGADRYLGQHGEGDVTISGAGGADRIYAGDGDDLLYGDRATSDAYSYDGDDLLRGGSGHDSLHGGGGADTLQGGADADVLTGDAGADVFLFAKLSDSAWSAPDLITDLEASDVIDLSGIDADRSQAGDQVFHLVTALSGHAGEAALSYDSASGLTRLELDVNGDGHADAVIAISGDATAFTGFVL